MSAHRNIDRICIIGLVLTLLLTVAFVFGEKLGLKAAADEDAESRSGSAYFTARDLDGDWADNAYTTYITLDGSEGTIKGNGAYFLNGDLVLTNGGWYVLSGNLEEGRILVDAADSSKLWIRLDGVTVHCSDDACLRIEQADKVFLTLAEGSENAFTSGSSYAEAALEDNTGGALFTHDDLTINGSGALTITAGFRHGIDANDSLVITGGTIRIQAPEDGIHVNDSFRFAGASLTVEAGDDAVHSDGTLYVESGSIRIPACCEGLEAASMEIAGGELAIVCTDDGLNANGTGETEALIRITGGEIDIRNTTGRDADGLDSNGSIFLDGGALRISLPGDGSNCALDYGGENGGSCVVTGGTLLAFGGSGMAEAFSSNCTQCAVLYNLDAAAQGGETFRVLDADGTELLAGTPESSWSSVAFSSPALVLGGTYTLVWGEESAALTLDASAVTVGGFGGMQQGKPGGMRPGSMQVPEEETTGEMPSMPEGGFGETPPMEDGSFGETPPTPPDGQMGMPPDGQMGTPPQSAEGNPQRPGRFGNRPGIDGTRPEGEGARPDEAGNREDGFAREDPLRTEETEPASESAKDAKPLLLLGASFLVLLLGIVLAWKYRR